MNSPVQTFNTGGVEVNPYPKLSVNVNSPIENNTVGSEIKNICPTTTNGFTTERFNA